MLKIGDAVGARAPPARSIVTATTAFCGRVPLMFTVVAAPPGNRPTGLGRPVRGITQASYVLPLGAAARPETWSVAFPFRSRTTDALT